MTDSNDPSRYIYREMLTNLLSTSCFPLIRSLGFPAKSAIPGSRMAAAINLSITRYVRRNGQVVSCVTSLKSGAAKRSKTVANLRVKPRLMRDNFEARKPLRKINGPEFPFWKCSFAWLWQSNVTLVANALLQK